MVASIITVMVFMGQKLKKQSKVFRNKMDCLVMEWSDPTLSKLSKEKTMVKLNHPHLLLII